MVVFNPFLSLREPGIIPRLAPG